MVKIGQINSEIYIKKIKCKMSDGGIAPISWLWWTDYPRR